ncbi:MAG: alpha/beta fold hydrolase [Terracidiphilus sp.]|jgi:pimeloyl-ACP methyl ester carboxylesterase
MPATRLSVCLLVISVLSLAAHGDKPVKVLARETLTVITAQGSGVLPLYVSINGTLADLSLPQPSVVRVLIVFHGKQRNADVYNESGFEAIKRAGRAGEGTLLITPQFLEQVDIDAFGLSANVLRWEPEQWMSGADDVNAHISSFDAIDGIVTRLGDRRLFPNLKAVVLVGHSAGGQLLQRYAVAGRAGDVLESAGIHVRYVVANPSSYVYFSPERPELKSKGEFTFAIPRKTCSGEYNRWKYGALDPPRYAAAEDFAEVEKRYALREVVYLLGTGDTDPNHPALDKSCPGEDEGPYRFYRGKAYFRYLQVRHPELEAESARQQLWAVPGVEHDGDKMLNSKCGLAALFDAGLCATRILDPKP